MGTSYRDLARLSIQTNLKTDRQTKVVTRWKVVPELELNEGTGRPSGSILIARETEFVIGASALLY